MHRGFFSDTVFSKILTSSSIFKSHKILFNLLNTNLKNFASLLLECKKFGG